MDATHTCIDCGRGTDEASFYLRTDNRMPFSRCVDCLKFYRSPGERAKRDAQRAADRELLERGMKRCAMCEETKQTSEFDLASADSRVLFHRCKSCRAEVARSYRSTLPGVNKTRRYRLEAESRRYGLTIEEILELRATVTSCELCSRSDLPMHIDHDHITGKFRGMLCSSCNQGLGKLGDTVEGLRAALRYLEERSA